MRARYRNFAITAIVLIVVFFVALEVSEYFHHKREQHYLDPNTYHNYSPAKANQEKEQKRIELEKGTNR